MKLSLFSLQSSKCCIFNVETVPFYFIECSWFGKYQQKESHPHAHTHTLTQEEVKGILCTHQNKQNNDNEKRKILSHACVS